VQGLLRRALLGRSGVGDPLEICDKFFGALHKGAFSCSHYLNLANQVTARKRLGEEP
jgi:hypothetical protein